MKLINKPFSVAVTILIMFLLFSILYSLLVPACITGNYFNMYKNFASYKYKNMDVYTIYDEVINPSEFKIYRSNTKNQEKICSFYNLLNTSKNINYNVINTQNIYIESSKIGDLHYDRGKGPDQNNMYAINSIQMNKNAFNLYIKQELVDTLDFIDTVYENQEIPILLGATYREKYKIGDYIEGNIYTNQVKLRVSGFLDQGVEFFWQNNNLLLDEYVILLYPNSLPLRYSDKDFLGILYFEMINGNVAVESSLDSLQRVYGELKAISDETKFDDYGIIGVSPAILLYDKLTLLFGGDIPVRVSFMLSLVALTSLIVFLHCVLYRNKIDTNTMKLGIIGKIKLIIPTVMVFSASLLMVVVFLGVMEISNWESLVVIGGVLWVISAIGILIFSVLQAIIIKRSLNRQ